MKIRYTPLTPMRIRHTCRRCREIGPFFGKIPNTWARGDTTGRRTWPQSRDRVSSKRRSTDIEGHAVLAIKPRPGAMLVLRGTA